MSRNALTKTKKLVRAFGLLVVLLGTLPLLVLCDGRAADLVSYGRPTRARVLVVQDPLATDAFLARPERVHAMVERAITNFTGTATVAEAWRSIISTNGVIATNDIVGIKVFSTPGRNSGTRPCVVAAVVEGLLAAGLPPKHIIVWDKQTIDLRLAGFFDLAERYGIRVAGSAQAGYDENAFYESSIIGNLIWGDVEFGRKGEGIGRKSFFSKLVSQQMTKIISITPMLNNNEAGVSGSLYSLVNASVDNFARFESEPARLATAVPEIYAKPWLSDRVLLNIVDALVAQYEGSERSLLHYSAALNQLRFSHDPVALDVLSILDLEKQRMANGSPDVTTNMDLYSNAALLELGVSDPKKIRIETIR